MTRVGLGLVLLALSVVSKNAYADFDDYRMSGSGVEVKNSRFCRLDLKPSQAAESSDQSVVIVSEYGYVPERELDHCQPRKTLHVRSIPTQFGPLADINLSKGIFIAKKYLSNHSFSYVATVVDLKTSRVRVFRHADIGDVETFSDMEKGDDFQKNQRDGFQKNLGGTSAISPDGRYISIDGDWDCSERKYSPGVWDLKLNRRVFTSKNACYALFGIRPGTVIEEDGSGPVGDD